MHKAQISKETPVLLGRQALPGIEKVELPGAMHLIRVSWKLETGDRCGGVLLKIHFKARPESLKNAAI